jgi:hypothetical protein
MTFIADVGGLSAGGVGGLPSSVLTSTFTCTLMGNNVRGNMKHFNKSIDSVHEDTASQ